MAGPALCIVDAVGNSVWLLPSDAQQAIRVALPNSSTAKPSTRTKSTVDSLPSVTLVGRSLAAEQECEYVFVTVCSGTEHDAQRVTRSTATSIAPSLLQPHILDTLDDAMQWIESLSLQGGNRKQIMCITMPDAATHGSNQQHLAWPCFTLPQALANVITCVCAIPSYLSSQMATDESLCTGDQPSASNMFLIGTTFNQLMVVQRELHHVAVCVRLPSTPTAMYVSPTAALVVALWCCHH
jgi:hypothetical protein